MNTPVTVIGLGLMGKALAAALAGNGYPTTAWNRSATAVPDGVTRLDTVAESSPTMVVCLSTYDVMDEVLSTVELRGRTVINLTSGTPGEARRAAAWAAERGAAYLDGAIMASPQMIGTPQAQLLYGGPKDLFAAGEPMLRVFGGTTVHLSEDPGVPLLYDLALLAMLYAAGQGLEHAQALVGTAGVSATEFQPYANAWLTHVIGPMAGPENAHAIDAGEHATDVSNINTNALAIGHVIRASQDAGLPADWLFAQQARLEQAVADGYGSESPTRLIDYLRKEMG
ncbi:NAD(P)-binding domain-containing protein [Nonomuraea sp. NPDC059023]|uniref:imine reductase family protein n=1 Tax=unclassified Nonomuraea TaxID=2593643 RepID=UPI00369773D0